MRRPGNRYSWGMLLQTMLTPELWVATQIRKRAKTMAWTRGSVRDYACALKLLVDPLPQRRPVVHGGLVCRH